MHGTYGYCLEQQYTSEGEKLPFGMLSIYPDQADILVLDGQHRASAFRYVSGVFESALSDIYSAFYEDEDKLDSFGADLPVTLIWFESEDDIDPRLISRNLFVTVNNTARKVSESRNILLNDREVPALITRFFYSHVARVASFSPDKFSLLHSGFDIDSDLTRGSGHVLTITNPAIFDYAVAWWLLGTATYDVQDSYRVKRDDSRNRAYKDQFGLVFSGRLTDRDVAQRNDYEERQSVVLTDSDKLPIFQEEFGLILAPVLDGLLNRFNLFKRHYAACKALEDYVRGPGYQSEEHIWDRVFLGGEGLYYSFMGAKT